MAEAIEKLFGAAIRRLRDARGWSQGELADRMNAKRTFIGTVERGETSITIRNMERFAKGLRIPISAIWLEIDKR